MTPTRKFTTLPDGDVRMDDGTQVRLYTTVGSEVYVEADYGDGTKRRWPLGGQKRENERLEDAVRRLLDAKKRASAVLAGWLGFVVLGGVVGGFALAFGFSGYWFARLWLGGAGSTLMAVSAGVCAVVALLLGWLLSILMRLEGAPWLSMLAVVALEGLAMAHWLNTPLF